MHALLIIKFAILGAMTYGLTTELFENFRWRVFGIYPKGFNWHSLIYVFISVCVICSVFEYIIGSN